MSNIKDTVALILENEGAHAVREFLNAHFNSREINGTYHHHFTEDEQREAERHTVKLLDEYDKFEMEVKEQQKENKKKRELMKGDLNRYKEAVKVGGIEKTGTLYTIIDDNIKPPRAYVYNEFGQLVDERRPTAEDLQRRIAPNTALSGSRNIGSGDDVEDDF